MHEEKKTNKWIVLIYLLLVIIFIIIAGIYVGDMGRTQVDPARTETDTKEQKIFAAEVDYENLEIDSDGDGLSDWQEALWGLDPENPDSDGNGVLDNLDDVDVQSTVKLITPDRTQETELKKHQAFVRNLFTTIFSLHESGNLNDETYEQVVSQAEQFVSNYDVIRQIYSRDDIRVVPHGQSRLIEYFDNLDEVFFKTGWRAYDPIIPLYYIEDKIEKEKFDAAKDRVHATLAEILQIAVPESVIDEHLSLTNTIATIKAMFTEIGEGQTDGDPFLLVAGVRNYRDVIDHFSALSIIYYELAELAEDSSVNR